MFGALLGLGGAGLSAFGSYMGGRQAQEEASYNAAIKRQQAILSEQAMEAETELMRDDARRLKATQEASFAASGAVVGEGTPLLVLAEEAGRMERDILQQRRNRMIEQQGLRSESQMLRFQGQQAKRAGTIGAVSTILGGGAKFGSLMGGQ